MTTALTTHQAVDDKVIQEYLFTSGTKLDEKQQALFLNIAKAFNLNPFKREIYPVAYENRKTGKIDLSIVTGYQVYLARADATGKLNGWHCSALYSEQAVKDAKGNETSHRRLDGAKIVIYRKDFDQPFEWEVSFRDFAKMYDGQLTGQWRQMPEFMIKKVCFDDKTKVLTDSGFKLFEDLTENDLIAQIDDNRKLSFVKPEKIIINDADVYSMISSDNSKIDMNITDDHRMSVIENEKIIERSAFEVFENMRQRKSITIPRTATIETADNSDWSDSELKLLGYYIADGYKASDNMLSMKCTPQYKIDAIEDIALHSSKKKYDYKKPVMCCGKFIENPLPYIRYLFPVKYGKKILSILGDDKAIDLKKFRFSARQLKLIVDAWAYFDGAIYHKNSVIYTSRENHKDMFQTLAVMAGYSVKLLYARKQKHYKTNYAIAISDIEDVKCHKYSFAKTEYYGKTYCVQVTAGRIMVQRNGYSFISGNCIGQGFRLAFPNELGGMPYLAEEITNEREDQIFQEEPKPENPEKPEEVANA